MGSFTATYPETTCQKILIAPPTPKTIGKNKQELGIPRGDPPHIPIVRGSPWPGALRVAPGRSLCWALCAGLCVGPPGAICVGASALCVFVGPRHCPCQRSLCRDLYRVPPLSVVPPIRSRGPQLQSACHPDPARRVPSCQERTPNLTVWGNMKKYGII